MSNVAIFHISFALNFNFNSIKGFGDAEFAQNLNSKESGQVKII